VIFAWVVLVAASIALVLMLATQCDAAVVLRSEPAVPEWSRLGRLAIRFMARRPGGEARVRHPDDRRFYRQLAAWAWIHTRETDIPPEVVLAVAFHESSWKPWVVGSAGEIGLMQLHGRRAWMSFDPETLLRQPVLNVWAGVQHLRRSYAQCGSLRRGLIQYASGSCAPRGRRARRAEYAADLVLRWADSMRVD